MDYDEAELTPGERASSEGSVIELYMWLHHNFPEDRETDVARFALTRLELAHKHLYEAVDLLHDAKDLIAGYMPEMLKLMTERDALKAQVERLTREDEDANATE
jgi:hypothetical protein